MRTIDRIIIHCAATPEGKYFDIKDIDRWHKRRGFKGCGYHYVILLDGTIQRGRPEYSMGAHCKGYNGNSIGVCYIGGLDTEGNAKDTRTKEQKHALKVLVNTLTDRYKLASVHAHNEFANKACPCFDVKEWLRLDRVLNNND